MTDFEPVDPDPARETPDCYISVSDRGTWYIPREAYNALFDGARYVAIAAGDGRVAIRPSETEEVGDWPDDGDDPAMYELSDMAAGAKRFSSSAALTQAGVRPDSTVRLIPRWDEDLDAIVVRLDEAVEGGDGAGVESVSD